MSDQWLTIAEVSDWLNVHPLMLRDWIRDEDIPTADRWRGDLAEVRIPASWLAQVIASGWNFDKETGDPPILQESFADMLRRFGGHPQVAPIVADVQECAGQPSGGPHRPTKSHRSCSDSRFNTPQRPSGGCCGPGTTTNAHNQATTRLTSGSVGRYDCSAPHQSCEHPA